MIRKFFKDHPRAKFWNHEENKELDLNKITCGSGKKAWFNCQECSHKFKSYIFCVTSGIWCPFCANKKLCGSIECQPCFNKSFASSNRAIYWDHKTNTLKPRQVFLSSNNKFWFICNCGHPFEMRLGHLTNNSHWCPFCANKKLCGSIECQPCFNKSFASSNRAIYWDHKTNTLKPRQVFLSSHNKFWFICNCGHPFEMGLDDITNGKNWCPFCANQKLCNSEDCIECLEKSFESSDKVIYWDYEINTLKPRQVFKSTNKKYHFICKDKHKFSMQLDSITNNSRWCGFCRNKTETLVYEWLKENFENVERQKKFDWCKNKNFLPFDFLINDTIVELDGIFHFQQVGKWKSPEEVQKRDIYKMNLALEHGYKFIRIFQENVWKNEFDWQLILTIAIMLISKSNVIYLSSDPNMYNKHKELLKIARNPTLKTLSDTTENIINKNLNILL